jgi:hypothetical protein
MGADLYIESVMKVAKAKWSPKFDAAVRARDEYLKAHPDAKFATGPFGPTNVPEDEVDQDYQKLVDDVATSYDGLYPEQGYFRDSYNGTSLFWRIGLSWWEDTKPFLVERKDDLAVLPIENFDAFLTMVREAYSAREILTLEYLEDKHCQHNEPDSVKTWDAYFDGKFRQLMCFVAEARRRDEPIEFSI